MKSLIFIADYGDDSLATSEALSAIRQHAVVPFVAEIVHARPFNTVHTGFLLEQLSRGITKEQGRDTVFFLNTDPRIQTKELVQDAKGAPLYAAFLDNDSVVITPNAGYCLSFVKERIIKLVEVNVSAAGTQFRSRDIFAKTVAKALDGKLQEDLGQEISIVDHVLDRFQESIVLHVDNYGNIKTSITQQVLQQQGIGMGDTVEVSIAGKQDNMKVGNTIFSVAPGSLVFAPGSSGDKSSPYFEASLRFDGESFSQSASQVFGNPDPGAVVKVIKQN
jgi:S-adenosylmethionine hydrolase